MKLAIIAANGRLGQALVTEALAAGHSVRAGLRGMSKLSPHPQLKVVKCDATDPLQLQVLLAGQDAVLSAIGHVRHSPADVQTQATMAIVTAMNQAGISRFIDITGSGVRSPGDHISLLDRCMNGAIAVIDQPRISDGRQHQVILQGSDLDWTTIRVLKLHDGQPRPYALSLHGPAQTLVSRRTAARAMLAVLSAGSHSRQAPIISKCP